jgi:hypothetical protein
MSTKMKLATEPPRKKLTQSAGVYTPTRSLDEAAGLLKDRYADLKRHYTKIRKEWPSYKKS